MPNQHTPNRLDRYDLPAVSGVYLITSTVDGATYVGASRNIRARISNTKRNFGEGWREEYVRRYPEHAEDV